MCFQFSISPTKKSVKKSQFSISPTKKKSLNQKKTPNRHLPRYGGLTAGPQSSPASPGFGAAGDRWWMFSRWLGSPVFFGWFPHQDAWKNHRETMQFRPIRLLVFRRFGVDRNRFRGVPLSKFTIPHTSNIQRWIINPIEPKIWMNKVGQRRYLGGGNSNIFWNFHPENWGRFSTHFDEVIFFKGVGEKPPTR